MRSVLTRLEASKGEVHARPHRTRGFGNRMGVVALRLIPHDQQVALAKVPAPPRARCPLPKHESSAIAEADRRDGWSRAQFGLIVAVIAH